MRGARSAARSSSSSSQAMSCFQGRWGELRLEGVGAQVPYEVGAGPDPADPEAAPHRLAQGAGLDHAGAGERGFGAGRGAQVEVAHRLIGDHREEEARGPRRSCARRWGSGSRGRGRQSDAPRVDGRRQVGEVPAVAGRHRQRQQTGPAAPADAPGGGAARRGRRVRPGAAPGPAALPDEGAGAETALARFAERWAPGSSGSAGPGCPGFVTGGATPASVAGDRLTAAYDQNVSGAAGSWAAALERETVAWLREFRTGWGALGGDGHRSDGVPVGARRALSPRRCPAEARRAERGAAARTTSERICTRR